MARRSRLRKALTLMITTAVALGIPALSAPAANASETPTFTAAVTEIPDERIDIAITGAGYGDVAALPGQTEPHAYFTLIEQGSDLAVVEDTQAAISAAVAADGTIEAVLPIPAADLDAKRTYEVISWPSRSFPTEQNLYSRTGITIDWAALFPGGALDRAVVTLAADPAAAYTDQEVTLTATISPAVEGSVSFWNGDALLGDPVPVSDGTATLRVPPLPVGDHGITARLTPTVEGYTESESDRVAVAVSERSTEGSLQWGIKSNFRSYVTGGIANGRIDASAGATQASGNGVFTFPQASSGSDWDGTTGTIQYAGQVLFYGHSGALNHTIANPSIRVTSTTSAELRIDYRGSSIVFATIDLTSADRQDLAGGAVRFSGARTVLTPAGTAFFSHQGHEFYSTGEALDRVTFTVGDPSGTEITEPPVAPTQPVTPPATATAAPARATAAASAGSLTWGVSRAFAAYTTCVGKEQFGYAHCAKGSISTDGVGDGYLFPQAEGSDWNAATQTGTVRFSGVVAFQGYGITMFRVANPSITVIGPASATLHTGNTTSFGASSYPLDLSSATRTEGANGEVTWSGVRVGGTLSGGPSGSSQNSIGFDDISFTVGTASAQTFGATTAGDVETVYEASATPPTTTGLDVLTAADRIREGGRIQVRASGFDADDSGVLVVLYPSGADAAPIVLDDAASADAQGTVSWSGTLPAGSAGAHVLTLQGSADAGAEINILTAQTAQTAVCAVTDGTLRWGVKESFRAYISGSIANGAWETADGAAYETPEFEWSGATGMFDPATGTGSVSFTGSVHFTGHEGVLDLTLANPTVEFERGSAALLLDARSTDMEGDVAVDTAQEWVGEIALADGFSPADGTVELTALPTTLTNTGADAFAGFYEAGAELDPLTLVLQLEGCDTAAAAPEPEATATAAAIAAEDVSIPWLPIIVGGAALIVIGFATGVLVGRRRPRTRADATGSHPTPDSDAATDGAAQ